MDNRKVQRVKPQYAHPTSVINRYFDFLMKMTYDHPVFMTTLVDAVGIAGLTLAVTAPLGRTVSAVAGAGMAVVAYASHFAQHQLYGLPVTDFDGAYHPDVYSYRTAKAEITTQEGHLAILRIDAENHYDAGYAEGYICGEAIKVNLKKTAFLYPIMCVLLGAPVDDDNLMAYLNPILNATPKKYREEMQGKVDGYNKWLQENHPNDEPLKFSQYVLYQLLPDLHNYNPFVENKLSSKLPSMPQLFGCTTIVLRLGKFTFVERVLDWPSHDVAGKYFIQVDRNISGSARTIDVGIPLLSGALTVLNAHGTLFEMNIAYGDKVKQPSGMPAVFMNRYCAEHAEKVTDIHRVLRDVLPLSAYHLTASDGDNTESFHFYQNKETLGQHEVEVLPEDITRPQMMVVANQGLRHAEGVPTIVNHKDSTQRKANAFQFFAQPDNQRSLQEFIDLQTRDVPSPADVRFIKNFMLEIARMALINKCDSVLCEMLVYFDGKLEDVSVVTDNLYAQDRGLEAFRQLSNPRFN